jgi:hypothetical protein
MPKLKLKSDSFAAKDTLRRRFRRCRYSTSIAAPIFAVVWFLTNNELNAKYIFGSCK